MKRIIHNGNLLLELPGTSEEYYNKIVGLINEIEPIFGDNYEIINFNIYEIILINDIGEYKIRILSEGQPEGDENEGVMEITFDVFFKKKSFKFLVGN